MLLLAMAMMSFSQLSAQESAVDDHGLFNHLSVGVGVGLTGISIEAAAPITPYVTVRGGVNIFPQIKVKTDLDLDGEIPASYNGPRSFEVEGKSSLTTGHLLFDVYPFKTSAFHVTAGAYLGSDKIITLKNTKDGVLMDINRLNASLPDGQKIGLDLGDYLLTPDERGNVDATLKVAAFRPYLGVGFGRAVPAKHRFAFNFDMGVQFWGTPEVYLRDHKLTKADTNSDTGEVLKYLSKATVYPVLNFRIVGRIL